jgi:hypothetical protein
MLEKDIEHYFKHQLERYGAKVWKFVSPGRRGVPDRLILLPGGRVRFAELKAPGKKPRPLQEAVFRSMKALGHEVPVIDSKADVDALIDQWRLQGLIFKRVM